MGQLQFYSADEAKALDVPWPDVYFTPGYGAAVEASDGAAWELAIWTPGPILYPYLKRPIDPALGAEGLFDVVSPYGYSGSWAPADVPESAWREFRAALRSALRERGGVAEFQRISGLVPGRDALLAADEQLVAGHHNDTVVIDVARGYDACWEAAEGRSRTKTRKARRLGYSWSCRVATAADVAAGSGFRRIYEETMQRVEAAPYYFFPDAYYDRLQAGLDGQLYLLEIRSDDEELAVAGIFVDWAPLVHLHLVGSERQAGRDGAGNLTYDGLIAWACAEGRFERLHVGGGMVPGDRMFYFKQSFGGEALPFWTARGTLDADRYAGLVAARAAQTGSAPELLEATGYFPAYRATPPAETRAA